MPGLSDKKTDEKENEKILEEIYDNENLDEKPNINIKKRQLFKQKIKEYFSKEGVVDQWITGAILFFGLVAVVLGFFQFRHNIFSYFEVDNSSEIELSQQESGDPDLLGQRDKDTDQDGLSDYDELYTYGTSPYLQDTDSDGTSDPDEIAAGSDPTCAAGQDCSGSFVNTEQVNPEDSANAFLSGGIQASQLRTILLEAGFTQEELQSLTDEQLLQVYQDAVSQIDTSEQSAQPEEVIVDLPVEDIQSLTPTQIRDLLQAQGIDRVILDSISDAELIDLVNEILVQN